LPNPARGAKARWRRSPTSHADTFDAFVDLAISARSGSSESLIFEPEHLIVLIDIVLIDIVLIDAIGIVSPVNQIELPPRSAQAELPGGARFAVDSSDGRAHRAHRADKCRQMRRPPRVAWMA
jgi:hypothetical protein